MFTDMAIQVYFYNLPTGMKQILNCECIFWFHKGAAAVYRSSV
jgi:hypothetical protein